MDAKQKTSEQELREIINDGDIEFFFRVLYDEYQNQIVRLINRATFYRLDEPELLDVFQQTVVEIWQKLERGNFCNESSPLRLVNRIATCRAVDALRKKTGLERLACNATDIADLLIDDFAGTQFRVDLRLAREEDKQRFREELPEVLATLTEFQQVAVLAFIDRIEEVRANDKYQVVARAIKEATGEEITVAATRSRLNKAFERMRSEFMRRRISFVEEKEL